MRTAYDRAMRMLQLAAILLALDACDKNAPPDPADAPPSGIDAPAGATCTGAAYDPCTDNTQCMSGNCHLFAQQALQVCVTSCTPGDNSTCPLDKTGINGVCNNMSICKPAAANACTR